MKKVRSPLVCQTAIEFLPDDFVDLLILDPPYNLTKSFNGDVEMRKTDHQLQQPLFVSVWQKTDAKNPYSAENTGYTLAPVASYESYVSSTPTSCQMKRP